MSRLKSVLPAAEYSKLKDMMWIVRKQHECLSQEDKRKLSLLYSYSPIMKKAHNYTLQLTHILNTYCNRKSAIAKINRWITKVQKSGLNCFDSLIETLEKYKVTIANYFKDRKNSGFVGG